MPGSTPSVFLRIPKNTLLLGAGSRGDSTIFSNVKEAWTCEMDRCQRATGCNALAYETQLPMKKRRELKAEDEQMREKKVAHGPITDAPKSCKAHSYFC